MAYSEEFRNEALIRLAVNKYDYKVTAEQMGVTVRSLRNWEKDFPKKKVPELLDRAIERMLMVIPDKWVGHDWAIALGILIDKWLLMQGEPTQRAENVVRGYTALTEDEREIIGERVRGFLGIGADGNSPGGDGLRSGDENAST